MHSGKEVYKIFNNIPVTVRRAGDTCISKEALEDIIIEAIEQPLFKNIISIWLNNKNDSEIVVYFEGAGENYTKLIQGVNIVFEYTEINRYSFNLNEKEKDFLRIKPKNYYEFILSMQPLSKELFSKYTNELGLHLIFQSLLSASKDEILSALRLIAFTLRVLDEVSDDIEDMKNEIITLNSDPKPIMLSNYYSAISDKFDKNNADDMEAYQQSLLWSLASALAFLEVNLQNPEVCIELFFRTGIYDAEKNKNSLGYIEYIESKYQKKNTNTAFDENIVKRTCKELGITQKELADKFGISTSAISQWGADIPKTAQVALELMIENHQLKKDLKTLVEGHKILSRLAVQNLDS